MAGDNNARLTSAPTRSPPCPPVFIFEYEGTPISDRNLERRTESLVRCLQKEHPYLKNESPVMYTIQAGTTDLDPMNRTLAGNTSHTSVQPPANLETYPTPEDSPLYVAVQDVNIEAVARYLSAHPNVMQSREGTVALMKAVEMETDELVDMMLRKSVCSNGFDTLMPTPLSIAVEKGNESIVRLLLRKGANYNAVDSEGRTPLIVAATRGHEETVRSLIIFGAGIEAADSSGRTAIHLASAQGHTGTVEVLIEERANISVRDRGCFSALHLALSGKCHDVVNLLLDHHADYATVNKDGDTALDIAIKNGDTAITRRLVSAGASLTLMGRGLSPLHTAAKYKQTEVLKLLLGSGAPANLANDELETALHIAAKVGHDAAVKPLVDAGCAINSLTRAGYSPLRLAVEENTTVTAANLLFHNACELITEDAKSTLLRIVDMGHSEMMAIFLSHRAVVGLRFESNRTLLHIAIKKLRQGVAAVLLIHGAAIDVKDGELKTPLTLAIQGQSRSMLALLLAHRPQCIGEQCFNEVSPLVYAAKQ